MSVHCFPATHPGLPPVNAHCIGLFDATCLATRRGRARSAHMTQDWLRTQLCSVCISDVWTDHSTYQCRRKCVGLQLSLALPTHDSNASPPTPTFFFFKGQFCTSGFQPLSIRRNGTFQATALAFLILLSTQVARNCIKALCKW